MRELKIDSVTQMKPSIDHHMVYREERAFSRVQRATSEVACDSAFEISRSSDRGSTSSLGAFIVSQVSIHNIKLYCIDVNPIFGLFHASESPCYIKTSRSRRKASTSLVSVSRVGIFVIASTTWSFVPILYNRIIFLCISSRT